MNAYEPTILTDGRKVNAESCASLEDAIMGITSSELPLIDSKNDDWWITCACCNGWGEHSWSPSGHGVDPDGGHYACDPCAGFGRFEVKIP